MQAFSISSKANLRVNADVRPRITRKHLVPKALAVPAEYGYVMASVAASAALVQWQAVRVAIARKQFGVSYPKMYAEGESTEAKTFNCTQRAHQNTLETLPALLTMIALLGLRFPITAAALGTIWNIGRIIYTLGYSTGDPSKRTPGAAISGLTYFICIFATGYAGMSATGLLG